jgi:hypothetical protein
MSAFEQDIRILESRIVDLTWPGGLFAYDEFREIHGHPSRYRPSAERALAGEDLSEQQKLIVALSMQKLPLEEYLDFAAEVIRLRSHGRISDKVLHWCILPTYDWNTLLVENYAREEVNRLLITVADMAGINEPFRLYVKDEVLTGKAKATVRSLKSSGQIS